MTQGRWIKVLTRCNDGRDRFFAGEVRFLPDAEGEEQASRLMLGGWAAGADDPNVTPVAPPAPPEVTLDVQSIEHPAAVTTVAPAKKRKG